MDRTYRSARAATGALFLVAVACDSLSAVTTEDVAGDVMLTAEQPVAAFQIELCATEDAPAEFEGDGSFDGDVRVNEGSVELTLENLEVDPGYEPPEGSNPPIQTEIVEGTEASRLGVILTLTPNGLVAGECTEPQVVQFSASGLEPGQTVTITNLEGSVSGELTNSLCPSNFSDASMSLEIERI